MTSPHFKTLYASALLFLFTAISHSNPAAAQYGVPQVRELSQRPYANSVILQGGTQAQTIQRLHVVRQYAFQNLRANPRVMLGAVADGLYANFEQSQGTAEPCDAARSHAAARAGAGQYV